ncbi:MBL fold metallo-hydrolase [Patescibacteria group bacterium]|nr:MBL fold metallo-hydrolase [Patescibacteria group bacterium]
MNHEKVLVRIAVLGGLLLTALLGFVFPLFSVPVTTNILSVTFLDVGQGDAVLIETPDGVQLLIDGGPDNTVLRRLSEELPWFDTSLDVVLGTHPDKDHIGGLVDVLKRYKVSKIITTENTGETMVASSFQKGLLGEGVPVEMARAGQVYQLGASTTLTVFAPANNPAMLESNTASIVARLSYGDIDFMLTGDVPSSIEAYLVKMYGDSLRSEVLKLGHHGSKTSSSDEFLDTVAPRYAVVSAGKDNSYGHPHSNVVDAVSARNITLMNTADAGSITFQTNGTDVWVQ